MKKRIGVTLLTLCMLLGLLPTMALAAEDNTSTASVDWNYGIAEVSSRLVEADVTVAADA